MNIIRWDGKPITEPGIYSHVPFEVYHGNPANPLDKRALMLFGDAPSISSSGLRKIVTQSPAHFWAGSIFNPRRVVEDEDTAAKALGRAAHWMLCRQPDFKKAFVERPEEFTDWRTKKAREWRDTQVGLGRTVLIDSQIEAIKGMAITLGRSALFRAGILDGEIELSMFYRDPYTGVWLKARPDVIPNDSGDFVDLKTTRSVQWWAMQATIDDYAYDQQAALVLLLAQMLGVPFESFTLVFIESAPPHCIGPVQFKDEDLLLADRLNRAALQVFADNFKKSKADPDHQWPGPVDGDDVRHIDLSDRARQRRKDKLEFFFGEAA